MVLIVKIPIFSGVRGRLCCVSDNSKGKGSLALKEKLYLGNPKIRYKCVIGLEIFLKPKKTRLHRCPNLEVGGSNPLNRQMPSQSKIVNCVS